MSNQTQDTLIGLLFFIIEVVIVGGIMSLLFWGMGFGFSDVIFNKV